MFPMNPSEISLGRLTLRSKPDKTVEQTGAYVFTTISVVQIGEEI